MTTSERVNQSVLHTIDILEQTVFILRKLCKFAKMELSDNSIDIKDTVQNLELGLRTIDNHEIERVLCHLGDLEELTVYNIDEEE